MSDDNPGGIQQDLDQQTAVALTALIVAICRQPGIDGQRLRQDFIDGLEGLSGSPQAVGSVGKNIAGLMLTILEDEHHNAPPAG